jgi:transcriptional regulator GlxA family with amidase domain
MPRPGDPLWLVLLRPAWPCRGLHIPAEAQRRWKHRLADLDDELAMHRPSAQTAVRALAALIVIDAARLTAPHASTVPALQPIVGETFAYIEDHYAEPISLGDVALGLSRSAASLARIVRSATGRTVNTWIIERRMAEARRLLAVTDDPIDVVARAVGFADTGYFRRRFREHHGVAPRDYRRKVRARDPRFERVTDPIAPTRRSR